ncbi:ATP-binding protein [uncultured Zhongshania sp.]|uniref:sensor histidine kinase n=1 Tax=uncultured Zhongshania sp. TaxID=1642288 RepID=UPI0025F47376|nr:ATP-binding protein [uncultured Zhongshania sp.]
MSFAQEFSQQRAIMRVYSAYRFVLAAMILIALVFGPANSTLGITAPKWFAIAVIGYVLFALLALFIHTLFSQRYSQTQLFFEFFVDIGVIMVMSYCSGSAESGLPLLLIVTISAASIVMPSQLSLAIAALATISTISEVAAHTLSERVSAQRFIVAGMTGTAYFSAAIAIRYLSSRIVKTQQLAERRRADIEQLSRINQRIVQRMQTGIVVMSRSGQIKLINAAATELLDIPTPVSNSNNYVPTILIDMARSADNSSKVISIGSRHLDVHVNMSVLEQSKDSDRLLYIENISKITQRAQNLKLASLGRFTASIAHEIRNPLSAISHAAQLLAESPDLQAADQRFAAIIQNHAMRMNDIIKNILEMSRGRSPEPARFGLSAWLEKFLDDWQPASHTPLDIEFDKAFENDDVNVDRSQLAQIISNIAENGARHGAQTNDQAVLIFRCLKNPSSGTVSLDIIDNGPGIKPEDEDKIFEPFFTTQEQGNGLGLYLCRELCLANQIHIYYRRTESGESCFRLQFSHPDRGALAE